MLLTITIFFDWIIKKNQSKFLIFLTTLLFFIQLVVSGVKKRLSNGWSGGCGFIIILIAAYSCYQFDATIVFNHDKKSRCLNLVALIVWLVAGFLTEKRPDLGGVDRIHWVFSSLSLTFLILSSLICLEFRTDHGLKIYKKVFGENTHSFINYSHGALIRELSNSRLANSRIFFSSKIPKKHKKEMKIAIFGMSFHNYQQRST